ncbi:FAD/NAD(P)-binding oxidoreductase, partial [archaeon]
KDIREALHSPLRPHTMDSVKRRTRALMGTCQGGDCAERMGEIISKETGLNKITKCGCHSVALELGNDDGKTRKK